MKQVNLDSNATGPQSWMDLPGRQKVLWVASFVIAFLIGIGMGIYLTFA